MSAATIITNATAGAPVLNGTEGSLSALFRYLAPILGWSIEFDNGPIIVVKPQSYKGGQALCYRIDDRAARGGAAPRVAEVRAYETMTDINTGAGLVGPAYMHKSYYANTTGYSYKIAGDAYGLHLNSYGYTATFPGMPMANSYIGFNIPISEEVPICLLMADGVDGVSSGGNLLHHAAAGSSGRAGLYAHKNRAGTINVLVACRGGLYDMETRGIGSKYKAADWTSMKWPEAASVDVSPIYVSDGSVFSLRGLLPGYSRQSQKSDGYEEFLGRGNGDNLGWAWGSLLIPTGDDFRP